MSDEKLRLRAHAIPGPIEVAVDGPADEPSLRTLGTGPGQAAAGDAVASGGPHAHAEYVETTDPRLSDPRTPTTHDHVELATDADLAAHAATPHGGDAGPHTHADYVLVTDPRLSDAREPTAHGHAVSDVSGLQAALDGKAATTHPHDYATPAQVTNEVGLHASGTEHLGQAEIDASIAAHVTAQQHGGGTAEPHVHDEYATDTDLAGHAGSGHVAQQPSIANVNRSGNASTQTTNLQIKVDEIIAAARAAGWIA